MSKVELILKEIENLTWAELWLVWEHLQNKIKMQIFSSPQIPQKKVLQLSNFSFAKTRQLLAGKNLNLSDAVIEERYKD